MSWLVRSGSGLWRCGRSTLRTGRGPDAATTWHSQPPALAGCATAITLVPGPPVELLANSGGGRLAASTLCSASAAVEFDRTGVTSLAPMRWQVVGLGTGVLQRAAAIVAVTATRGWNRSEFCTGATGRPSALVVMLVESRGAACSRWQRHQLAVRSGRRARARGGLGARRARWHRPGAMQAPFPRAPA